MKNSANVKHKWIDYFLLEKIFKRSLKSHLIIIIDSATTLIFRKTTVRIFYVLIVHSRYKVLISCKSHVDVSWRLSQKLSLEVFKLFFKGSLLQFHIELFFSLQLGFYSIKIHVSEFLAKIEICLMKLLSDLRIRYSMRN